MIDTSSEITIDNGLQTNKELKRLIYRQTMTGETQWLLSAIIDRLPPLPEPANQQMPTPEPDFEAEATRILGHYYSLHGDKASFVSNLRRIYQMGLDAREAGL